MNRENYKDVRNTDLGLTAVDAVKETAAFGAKGVALGLGATIGVLKASANTIRDMKADKDSMLGEVARKSIKGNYKTAQYRTYELFKGNDDKKSDMSEEEPK